MTESRELERVYDGEIVDDEPSWDDYVVAWGNAAGNILINQFRQAKIAANVNRIWGSGSIKTFAKSVGLEKSHVYNFARVWWLFGHFIENGDDEFSRRLESGMLTFSHFIESTYAPDPLEAINEAEDEGLSTRAIKAKNQERKELEHATDERAQTAGTMDCPDCTPCSRCNNERVIPVD